MTIEQKVRAQNRAILRPIIGDLMRDPALKMTNDVAARFFPGLAWEPPADDPGFGDPTVEEDYRAWGPEHANGEQLDSMDAAKLKAENHEGRCDWCGKTRCDCYGDRA